jgi:hypothetical protein
MLKVLETEFVNATPEFAKKCEENEITPPAGI